MKGVVCFTSLSLGFCFPGKSDDQLPGQNLDTRGVGVNDVAVVNRRVRFEMSPNRLYDQRFDLGCRHAAYGPSALGVALEEGGRQIIAILDTTLSGVGRAHDIAPVIEEPANQQGLRLHPRGLVLVDLFTQLGLDGMKQGVIDNGGLLAFEGLALEGHFSNVEAIAEQVS